MIRVSHRCLLALAFLTSMSSTGCTVIGYQVGKGYDSRGFQKIHGATLRDVAVGWDLRLTTNDATFEGTVLELSSHDGVDRIVIRSASSADADTLHHDEILAIERGGQLGTPTAVGTFLGIIADVSIFWWFTNELNEAFSELR